MILLKIVLGVSNLPMDSMDIKKLKNFVLEKKLVEQTIEGFWEAFNYWKIEYPKEFTRAFRKKFDPTNLELYK